jgi:hypothetical protein
MREEGVVGLRFYDLELVLEFIVVKSPRYHSLVVICIQTRQKLHVLYAVYLSSQALCSFPISPPLYQTIRVHTSLVSKETTKLSCCLFCNLPLALKHSDRAILLDHMTRLIAS